VQDIVPVLVLVLGNQKDVAAVGAEDLVGPFWHQQVLLAVEALLEHLVVAVVHGRVHDLVAGVTDNLVEVLLVQQPGLAVPAQHFSLNKVKGVW
jgi:hypothetical protein